MDTTEPVEMPIEDRIAEAENLIKAFKSMDQTPGIKAMLGEQVSKLKGLRDQQKEARPPLARLQAATARNAAAQAALQASTTKKAEALDKFEEATKEQSECEAKAAETEEEVRACTELLATSAAVGNACQASRMCEFMFSMLQIGEAEKQALAAQVQANFPAWLVSQGAAEQAPDAGAAAATILQQTAAVTAAEAVQLQAAATAAAARATAAAAAAAAAGQQQAATEFAAAAAVTQAAAAATALPARLAAPGTPVGALLLGRRPTRSHSPGRGRNSLLLAAA
jgi:hypothetical protein